MFPFQSSDSAYRLLSSEAALCPVPVLSSAAGWRLIFSSHLFLLLSLLGGCITLF